MRVLHVADLETTYDDPDLVGRLAGTIADLRGDDTAVVGAGDDTALGALALATDAGPAQALPFLDTVDLDAEVVGNHDLDAGAAWFASFAERTPFPWLGANVDGLDAVDPWTLVEVADGRVGLVGLVNPETPELVAGDLPFTVTDPLPAAREAVEACRSAGADRVVVCSHCGGLDADLARDLDVAAVLGGHDHDRVVERVDGTVVARTTGGGDDLVEVDLDAPAVRVHDVREGPRDDSLADAYRDRWASAGLAAPVARVDRVPRDHEARVGGESRVGNFVADAYRATADADVGLILASGLRGGRPFEGAVERGEVVGLTPFDTTLHEFRLTGDELQEVLRSAGDLLADTDALGVPVHLSGARARWTDGGYLVEARVDGDPVGDGPYRLATTSYVPRAGVLPPLSPAHRVATHGPQYEALVDHARRGGLAVEREGRVGTV